MDAASLRPLSVGEILDAAIKIFRERFSHMVKAVAVVVVPLALLNALVQLSLAPVATDEQIFAPIDQTTGQPTIDQGEAWAVAAGLAIAIALAFLAAELAAAACLKLVSGAYLDEPPNWRASLAAATSRLGALVWLSLLFFLALVAGFFLCVVPAIYLGVAFTVAVPVLLLENLRGTTALRRSRDLVKGRWWQALGVMVVSGILAFIVQLILAAILLAVVGSGDNDVVEAVAGAVANIASSLLTTPFAAAAIMVLYFDLRVRKEGFDLELLSRRVGVDPSAWPDAPPADAPRQPLPPDDEPPSTGWRPDG